MRAAESNTSRDMARRRKTKVEREAERSEQERRTWEQFRPSLEAIRCKADAIEILKGMPQPDTSLRKHYTNLSYFMATFSPPGNSSGAEKVLYIEVSKKLAEAGELSEGAQQKVEAELRLAIEKQWQ